MTYSLLADGHIFLIFSNKIKAWFDYKGKKFIKSVSVRSGMLMHLYQTIHFAEVTFVKNEGYKLWLIFYFKIYTYTYLLWVFVSVQWVNYIFREINVKNI